MPRRLELTPHLSTDDLEHRYRQCRDPGERSHWHMLWLVTLGHHVPAVATLTGYSVNWVRTIVHRYNADGPSGIVDRRLANPGHSPLLSPELSSKTPSVAPPRMAGSGPGARWQPGWLRTSPDRWGNHAAGRRCDRSAGRPNGPGRGRPMRIPSPRQPSKKGASGPGRCGKERPSDGAAHALGRG